jgi:hypothetical protein
LGLKNGEMGQFIGANIISGSVKINVRANVKPKKQHNHLAMVS